ncbi:MAG TPA: T9SS type A sorting domain-containing protein [Chitinophagaceae bacterium]|nr:T9SS type A sorting domain-containing protein [Chitinophagaceae bacterium]
MKSKILFQFFLLAGLGSIFFTMKSDVNGKYNGGNTCGSCHGNVNTATSVALVGLPSTYETGKTYNLTYTITNATNTKAGFNIMVSSGTLTAGAGSKVNTAKTQITHTSPKSATSNVTTFDFTWTAPSIVTTANFTTVGNAVNDNNDDDAGDQWNTQSYAVQGGFPASVSSVDRTSLTCFPNPSSTSIQLQGIGQDAQVDMYTIQGQRVNCHVNNGNISVEQLTNGIYFIHAVHQGKTFVTSFTKN